MAAGIAETVTKLARAGVVAVMKMAASMLMAEVAVREVEEKAVAWEAVAMARADFHRIHTRQDRMRNAGRWRQGVVSRPGTCAAPCKCLSCQSYFASLRGRLAVDCTTSHRCTALMERTAGLVLGHTRLCPCLCRSTIFQRLRTSSRE